MGFCCQPEAEVVVGVKIVQFFFKCWQPSSDQVQVLQTQPMPSFCAFMEKSDRYFTLPLTHCYLLCMGITIINCMNFAYAFFFHAFLELRNYKKIRKNLATISEYNKTKTSIKILLIKKLIINRKSGQIPFLNIKSLFLAENLPHDRH